VRILVTGASGFVGRAVVQRLLGDGHTVLGISRNRPDRIIPNSNLHWIQADLSSPGQYQGRVRDFSPEIVVHLAWQDIPDYSFDVSKANLDQSFVFFTFLFSVESCSKVLVAGSCWELNRSMGSCLETEIGMPTDNFTWAKHALRSWLEIECQRKHVDLGWIRLFYVYGRRQRSGSLIPSILECLRDGQLPELRTPRNAHDFVYVDDVADGFSRAVSRKIPSGIYHLGSGQSTPVLDICRLAEKIVSNSEQLTIQLEVNTRANVCRVDFWADCTSSRQELGWVPETNLYDGIAQTWEAIK